MGEMTGVLLLGLAIGGGMIAALFIYLRSRERHIHDRGQARFQQDFDQQQKDMIDTAKTAFAALSKNALSENADDFIKLAKTRLDSQTAHNEQTLETKKKLIDARLKEMDTKLNSVNTLMQNIEKQRVESHGSLKSQLEKTTQATNRLQDTTSQLREALANPQRRGQWGERMAEDVLRLAGFVEGINYDKQKMISAGTKPDFTFYLPGDQIVHMDVKFPLANYLKMLDASEDAARDSCQSLFLKDVRSRIKEVTTRDYIDPASGTVDYVMVFIPNEQIYGFIHEHDSTLLDDAMKSKVVLCSPLTLYAILAIIRQAVDNFRLEQGAKQILDLLAEFKKQWGKYGETMDTMGNRLDDVMKAYTNLTGVRTRMLERQIDKIDDLREAQDQKQATMIPSSQPKTLDRPNEALETGS